MIKKPILLVFLSWLPFSMAVGEKKSRELSLACTQILEQIPNADLISDLRKENVVEIKQQLLLINEAFSPQLKFSEAELQNLLVKFPFVTIEEHMQLRNLFSKPKDKRYYFVSVQPGQLGEWEKPIHDFLVTILKQEIPTRDQIEFRRKNHAVRQPLNPIQIHRRENLRQFMAPLEAKLGQAVMFEEELDYAAREVYLADYFKERLEIYEKLEGPLISSVLYVKNLLRLIGKNAHSFDSPIVQIDELAALICAKNNDALNQELHYYFSKASHGMLVTDQADLISLRINSWLDGFQDYHDFINTLITEELKRALLVTISDEPFYTGFGNQLYLVSKKLLSEREANGVENLKQHLSSFWWKEAKVRLLGQWELSHMAHIFGKVIDENPISTIVNVFEVAVPSDAGMQYFAMDVRIESNKKSVSVDQEDYLALYKDYKEFDTLKIKEIRSLSRAARVQDAFRTDPIDLREPLVKLVESEGTEMLKGANQMVIRKIKAAPSDNRLLHEAEFMPAAGEIIANAFMGAPKGDYASVLLFKGYKQVGVTELFLPLVAERSGHEIYETEVKFGALQRVKFTLDRNVLNDSYTVQLDRLVGKGSFSISVAKWSGQFRAP